MKQCVLLVNWNGWKDTLECLESVLRLNCPDYQVILCDNGSTDGSLEKIRSWAKGELQAPCANPALQYFTFPGIPKPFSYEELSLEDAEAGARSLEKLVVIRVGADRGFAGGNNVGLRYALGDPECEYFWVLNNDTIVEPNALSAMLLEMKKNLKIGICGSLNLAYYQPNEVQVQGGYKYNRWTARVHTPARSTIDALRQPERFDYVNGSSMLVNRAFLEQVGFMEERYFFYFEELDWITRARGRYELGYTSASVIYHKEGASIGSSFVRSKRSVYSEKFNSRSKIIFTKKFYPLALPTVVVSTVAAAAHRFITGDPKRALTMLKWMLDGITGAPLDSKSI
jgi:GT2 family glycosyltransferase